MLIYTNQKSKKKKNLTKKQRELDNSWNELIDKYKPKKVLISNSNSLNYKLTTPAGRETKQYPSLNSGYYDTFKKENKVYTGDKMKGIGTLHKSNAVPIFTDDEAKDQANMRR
jgi:5-methylcytosine-specific restriction endonuclease McrBC GTP-binding regulatory subunit McrB